jgi:hypothetical protein
MIQPVNRSPRQNKPLDIRYFLGMDETGTRDVRRSPDMLNCILDDEGTPEMRPGYERVYADSLGPGPILGIHRWSGDVRLIHHGTKLYLCSGIAEPQLFYTGLSGLRHSISFTLSTKLCIIDGTKFLVFNGTTIEDAQTNAYVPLFLQGTPPLGGGTRVEDLNLLSPSWRQKFSTVSGTTTYTLWRPVDTLGQPMALDAIENVWLNGVLTTAYTVNLATGVLTLNANPGAGTNNLEVQPRKVGATDPTRILKCTTAAVYGGPSDSKIFLTGNPDYPHIDWWTGLPLTGVYDPTYWPDTNFDRVGGDNDFVVGYAVQHDKMIVFKRESIFVRSWELTEDAFGRTIMQFPAVNLNAGRGAYDADSIQIINNNPYFLSDDGVYEVVSTTVRDERNVEPVSSLVPSLKASGHGTSIDFENRYYLALEGGVVWVCDYRRQVLDEAAQKYQPVWYRWDNMPVNVWCSDGENLLFGSSEEGLIYRIKNPKVDKFPYNDEGQLIKAHFDSIFTTFDRDDMTKLVQSLFINQKMWSRAEIDVEYFTEEGMSGVIHTERIVLMDFIDIDFGEFSFLTSRFAKTFKVRVDDARNIQRFKLRLSSADKINRLFGFSSIAISYQTLSEVR